MTDRDNALIVGSFVLMGIAGFLTLLLSFAGNQAEDSLADYIVLFESDVSGLTLGSPVRYLGVDVGQVTHLRISGNTHNQVYVEIEIDSDTYITSATYASLAYLGVTGVAFINLSADPALPDGPLVASSSDHPIIPTRNTGLVALLSDSEAITSRVSSILDKIDLLLNEESRTDIQRTVYALRNLSEALAQESDTIKGLPSKLESAIEQLSAATESVRSVVDSTNPDIVSAISSLRKTSDSLAVVTSHLEQVLVSDSDELRTFVEGGLAQVPELLSETRRAIREIQKLVEELRDDPSQIIYEREYEAVPVSD